MKASRVVVGGHPADAAAPSGRMVGASGSPSTLGPALPPRMNGSPSCTSGSRARPTHLLLLRDGRSEMEVSEVVTTAPAGARSVQRVLRSPDRG